MQNFKTSTSVSGLKGLLFSFRETLKGSPLRTTRDWVPAKPSVWCSLWFSLRQSCTCLMVKSVKKVENNQTFDFAFYFYVHKHSVKPIKKHINLK